MRCQEAKTMLYAYLDRSLRDEVERELFIHLSNCHNCRQELNYARQTHSLLEKHCTMVEPPPNFTSNVMAAINRLEEQKTADKKIVSGRFGKQRNNFSWNIKRLGQVASVALLSATVWWASQFGGGFQIARTPEPGQLPGTETVTTTNPHSGKSGEGSEVALKDPEQKNPGSEPSKVNPGERPVTEEPITGETGTQKPGEQGFDLPPQEPLGAGDKNQPIESNAEPIVETPKNPEIHVPIPPPTIIEPNGPIIAAGAKDNDVLASVMLERINPGKEGSNYSFVSPKNKEGKILGEISLDGKPVISPDGKETAYGQEGKIYLIDGSTQDTKIIAEIGGQIQRITWSDKGTKLAANVSGGRGQQGIWAGSAKDEWQLLVEIGGGQELLWSPDGEKLAFTDHRGMAYVLTFQDGVKNKLYPITPEPGEGASGLAWSSNSDALLLKWSASDGVLDTWVATLPK